MEEITVEATGEGSTGNESAAASMLLLLLLLHKVKPNDRSETDRRYAVTITMVEQAYAYLATWIPSEE